MAQRRLLVVSVAVAAGVLAPSSGPSRAAPKAGVLTVTGTTLKSKRWVRGLIGRPPRALRGRLAWGRRSAKQVQAAYVRDGFDHARVWYQVAAGGEVRLHVDEGKMSRVELVGSTDIVKHILFPLDLSLPEGIFRRHLVNQGLGRLRVRHKLGPLTYRVLPGAWFENALGQRVRRQLLQVRVNRDNEQADDEDSVGGRGFGFKLTTDLRWGANVVGTAGFQNLLLKGDSLYGRLEIGLPLGRLMFDEDGTLLWVFGRLQLAYNFPDLGNSRVHPHFNVAARLYFDGRSDLGLSRALTLRWNTDLGLIWRATRGLTIALIGRYAYIKHMRVEIVADWPEREATPETDGTSWAEVILGVSLLDPDYTRRDMRSRLYVTPRLITDGEAVALDVHALGHYTLELGSDRAKHYLIFRAQAWALLGDVRYWDERPLSGRVHRVFMSPYIWAREAAQAEIAWRFPVLGEELMVGLFNDVSVFVDRSGVPHISPRLSVANVVGVSAHSLLFHFFAIDVFYGLGFAKTGQFTHTLTFTMKNVF